MCFVNVREDPPPESEDTVANLLSAMKEQRRHSHDFWRRLSHQEDTAATKDRSLLLLGNNNNHQNQRALNSHQTPKSITKVEIYEYDTTDELNVINQTEITNSTQNLSDGSSISFTSISTKLDPSIPIQDQPQYHPNGLIVKISGYTLNDKFVSNTFAWEYSIDDCSAEQVAIGDSVGWVDVSVVRPAAGAFCPAAVTAVPSLSPSAVPSERTEPPTDSPVVSPTSSPTPVEKVYPTSSKAAKRPKSVAAYSYIYNDWSNNGWSDDYSDDWSNGWSSSSDSSHSKPTPTPVYNSPTATTLSNDNIYDWSEVEKDDVSESASSSDGSSSSTSSTTYSTGAKASKW